MAIALPPDLATRAATRLAAATSRSTTATAAPSLEKAEQIAPPMPPPPPVTSATRRSSLPLTAIRRSLSPGRADWRASVQCRVAPPEVSIQLPVIWDAREDRRNDTACP